MQEDGSSRSRNHGDRSDDEATVDDVRRDGKARSEASSDELLRQLDDLISRLPGPVPLRAYLSEQTMDCAKAGIYCDVSVLCDINDTDKLHPTLFGIPVLIANATPLDYLVVRMSDGTWKVARFERG